MNYDVLGKTCLRVSQLALGTGNFGTGWGYGASAEDTTAIFEAYAEAGGNFIDTADVYQFGQSEEIVGKALEGRREAFLLATKFSSGSSPDRVAIAWVGTNGAVPIIGARTLDQFASNVGAASPILSPEQIARLDRASAADPEHPRRTDHAVA